MNDLLNGFNNGIDKSDGIGGNKPEEYDNTSQDKAFIIQNVSKCPSELDPVLAKIEKPKYHIITEINKDTDLENTTKQPCFLHDVMSSVYHWMINNLPFKLMYKHCWIDSQHKMWLPRWGWSKRQIADAEIRAKELAENIKWE